jgi:protein involved in polysaccharide export with SLBB domain
MSGKHTATSTWRDAMSKAIRLGACLALPVMLLASGCATSGASGDSIILLGENGKNREVTPEEIDRLSGIDSPYYVQVGDVVSLSFRMRTIRADEAAWDYKIEPGDSMEVRFLAGDSDPGTYKLEVGDVIGISFLDNWQLNVTRTVRVDGMVTAPEVGDVQARGLTPHELREQLKQRYIESGIIQGEPRITVNVDFVNLDRYGDMSRDVIVRPDGAIRVPGINTDLRIAGLTVAEASRLLEEEAAKVLKNRPRVTLVLFPAVDTTILDEMNGPVQVRPDGKISVPRIGEVQAAGYSVDELSYTLEQLAKGIINNPVEPNVDLLKTTGGRIYVGGEVQNPGVYPLEGAPSALQAVIMAQGFNNDSRRNNVIVVRRNPNGKPLVFNANLRVALHKGHTENDIMLRPFDIVYVPKKTISKLDLFVEQYIDELVPFDNSMGITGTYYMNEQSIDSKSRSVNFNTGATGVLDVLNP